MTPRRVWLQIGRWLLLYLGAQLLAAVLSVAIIRQIEGGSAADGLSPVELVRRHLSLHTAVTGAGGIAVTLLLWTRVDGRRLADFGLPRRAGPVMLGAGLGLALATAASLPAAIRDGGFALPEPAGLLRRIGPLLTLGVVAGHEEIAFRGYLFRRLREVFRPWVAVAMSTVMFSAMHAANPGLGGLPWLNLHLAGALLAMLALAGGSLGPAIGFHFAWNVTIGLLFALPVSGLDLVGGGGYLRHGAWLWTGGPFGPEGSLTATLALIAGIALVARAHRVEWNRSPEMNAMTPPVEHDAGAGPEIRPPESEGS